MSVSSLLKQSCIDAFFMAFPDKCPDKSSIEMPNMPNTVENMVENMVEITEATSEEFGHFQCNGAMKLSKILKMPPVKIAEAWLQKLNEIKWIQGSVASIDIKGPGFINFKMKPQFFAKRIQKLLTDPRLGISLPKIPEKVIIEFSSPNVAKEMHVGHIRSTIIGDCLRRLFTFLGHTVLPVNHVGDWGTQFGMLIAYLETVAPSLMAEKISEETHDQIHLSNLAQWYKEAKKKFDEDPAFKKQSQQEVVSLQQGDKRARRVWEHICEISREAYEHIYRLLDVTLVEKGESFYNPLLPKIIEDLNKKGMITVSDGAKCVYLDGFTNREGEPLPLIVQKSDGGYNYASTDLAALYHRVQEEKVDEVIYVVDAGQSLHFQMIFAAAAKAGYYDPQKNRVVHVPFGLVLRGDGKKFKTREGDTERLVDLIQTAIDKAKAILIERNPEFSATELSTMSEILGINAIKYADLSCNRLSDYMFSYDKMLKFEGNTAAFIMYAFVRILSIQRKTNVKVLSLLQVLEEQGNGQDRKDGTDLENGDNRDKDKILLVLEESAEISLGLHLCQFEDVLLQMKDDLMPNRLTDYLYRLAEKFHVFFHQCRVEGSPQQNSRLLLCEAVGRVLKQGMQLLGLKPLERM